MSKHKFVTEFEINASKKMLFPYLNSPAGLSQWFADDVTIDQDKVFYFNWDNDIFRAKIATQRINESIKFEFLPKKTNDTIGDPSYIELKLDMNELTQVVYLKITDYSDFEDEEELQELWKGMVHNLKEIVGG